MEGSWREALLDILFPGASFCCFCARKMVGQRRAGVCPQCREQIDLLEDLFNPCRRCGFFSQAPVCPNCRDWDEALERVIAVVPYEGRYKELVQNLKYQERLDLAEPLASLMAEKSRKAKLHKTLELIVPVPLHPAREKERGYNQSLCLAQSIARKLGLPLADAVLIRQSYLKTQTGLSRLERAANISKAFRVIDRAKIRQKNILLVDDIITTGATLSACAAALKEGGARLVCGVTWAAGSGKKLSEAAGNY